MPEKIAALALELFVASTSILIAQDEQKPTHKGVRTLSGCLERGMAIRVTSLTDAKGDNWEIKGIAVVWISTSGTTVRVTGVVSDAAIHGAKKAVKETASERGVGDSTEHGHITVTGLKLLNGGCSK